MRRATQQAPGSTVDIDEVAHELVAPDAQPGQTMDLQRCLLRLPPDQRAVLLLVSVEDMSYADVAKITGVPIGTVMSRLSRGRSRLQALLDTPVKAAGQPPVACTPVSNLHRLK
jgi:RNA polymerase sigma-70 factor (ECF subfamily)